MESLKKNLIHSFYTMPLIDNMKNEKVIIVTHAGIITGSPITNDEPDEAIRNMASISSTFATDYRKENAIDESRALDGNDGFISLKDVDFKSNGITCHFNILNVFFDQIVGITIGSYN